MSLTELTQSYIDTMQSFQLFSPSCRKSYRAALRAYARWAGAHAPGAPFDPQGWRDYYVYLLNERQIKPQTVKNYFSGLNGFCTWLAETGKCAASPMPAIKFAKSDPPVRLLITDEEIFNLIAACDKIHNPAKSAMMKATMFLLTSMGLRRDELINLQVSHICLADDRLEVRRGKGNKARTLYMTDQCTAVIDAWLKLRPKNCKHPYILTRSRIHRVGYEGLTPLMAELSTIAGYKGAKNQTPHSCRHWCATFRHRGTDTNPGMSIHDLMHFLGHGDISTTQRYLHTGSEVLRKIRNISEIPLPVTEEVRASTKAPEIPVLSPVLAPVPAAETTQRPTSPTNLDLAARNGQNKRRRLHSIRAQR